MNEFCRSAYNYDMNEVSDATGIDVASFGPSMAKQAFAEECDINTIVRRFGLMGELPVNVRMPTYGDFTGLTNYHEALNAIAAAHESFDAMPAEVRARFHNDPAEFVAFCNDEKNRPEAEKLGLVDATKLATALAAPGPAVGAAAPTAAPGAAGTGST